MRGGDRQPGELFSYIDLEARVRRDHPPYGACASSGGQREQLCDQAGGRPEAPPGAKTRQHLAILRGRAGRSTHQGALHRTGTDIR